MVNTVGVTAGSFDLFHSGHVLMLQEVSEQVETMLVLLQEDPTLDRPEKNKPIQTINEREIQVKACRYVHDVIIYSTEHDLYLLLTSLYAKFGTSLIRFLGEEYEGRPVTGDTIPIELRYNSRRHSYSSTELRQRIYGEEVKLREVTKVQ